MACAGRSVAALHLPVCPADHPPQNSAAAPRAAGPPQAARSAAQPALSPPWAGGPSAKPPGEPRRPPQRSGTHLLRGQDTDVHVAIRMEVECWHHKVCTDVFMHAEDQRDTQCACRVRKDLRAYLGTCLSHRPAPRRPCPSQACCSLASMLRPRSPPACLCQSHSPLLQGPSRSWAVHLHRAARGKHSLVESSIRLLTGGSSSSSRRLSSSHQRAACLHLVPGRVLGPCKEKQGLGSLLGQP